MAVGLLRRKSSSELAACSLTKSLDLEAVFACPSNAMRDQTSYWKIVTFLFSLHDVVREGMQ